GSIRADRSVAAENSVDSLDCTAEYNIASRGAADCREKEVLPEKRKRAHGHVAILYGLWQRHRGTHGFRSNASNRPQGDAHFRIPSGLVNQSCCTGQDHSFEGPKPLRRFELVTQCLVTSFAAPLPSILHDPFLVSICMTLQYTRSLVKKRS